MGEYEIDHENEADFSVERGGDVTEVVDERGSDAHVEDQLPRHEPEKEKRYQEHGELGPGEGIKPSFSLDPSTTAVTDSAKEVTEMPASEINETDLEALRESTRAVDEQRLAEVRAEIEALTQASQSSGFEQHPEDDKPT